jgi:TolB protein
MIFLLLFPENIVYASSQEILYSPSGPSSDEVLETSHFIIYYQPGSKIFAEEIAEIAESIYQDATSSLQYKPHQKIKITIYPSDKTFGFGGCATTSDSIVLYYGCQFSSESHGRDYLDRKRQVTHEFIHCLMDQKLNKFSFSVLQKSHFWISEGIATYYSSKNGYYGLLSKSAIRNLEETDTLPVSFGEIDEYSYFSYFLSYSVIAFIIEKYNEDKLIHFLDELQNWNDLKSSAENVDNALVRTFHKSKKTLEEEWISYLEKEFIGDFGELQFDSTQITDFEGFKIVTCWHENTLFFVSDCDHDLDIFALDMNTKEVQQLTDDPGADFDGKVSPDGEKIAFTSRRDGYCNIYTMNMDGSEVKQLTFGKTIDVMGSWSPDSKKIAFTSSRNDNYDIYIMDMDSLSVIQLTDQVGQNGFPTFSPDGQHIVFVSTRNGNYDLYSMTSDGKKVKQLTNTPGYENFPVYSPDGNKIAFISKKEEGSDIYMMNADGSNLKKILSQPRVIISEKVTPLLVGHLVWSPNGNEIAFACGDQIFTISTVQSNYGIIMWVVIVGLIIFPVLIYLKMKFQRDAVET